MYDKHYLLHYIGIGRVGLFSIGLKAMCRHVPSDSCIKVCAVYGIVLVSVTTEYFSPKPNSSNLIQVHHLTLFDTVTRSDEFQIIVFVI